SERPAMNTLVASTDEPAPSDAPRLSTARANSTAEREPAPRPERSAVMEARPDLPAGSAAAPAFTRRLAETSGRPGLDATITRRPLASVFSVAPGTLAATAAPAAGGCTRLPSSASLYSGISAAGIEILVACTVVATLIVAPVSPFFAASAGR